MTSTSSADRAPATHAWGLIAIDGSVRYVRIHQELLFLDARAYFEDAATAFETAAQLLLEEGEANLPENQPSIDLNAQNAAQIRAIMSAGHYIPSHGLWTRVVNRAKMPQWSAPSRKCLAQYVKRLVAQDDPLPEEPNVKFILVVAALGVSKLFLDEDMKEFSRYTGPSVVAEIVPGPLMPFLATQIFSCGGTVEEAQCLAQAEARTAGIFLAFA
jgi:hypothetical protein